MILWLYVCTGAVELKKNEFVSFLEFQFWNHIGSIAIDFWFSVYSSKIIERKGQCNKNWL